MRISRALGAMMMTAAFFGAGCGSANITDEINLRQVTFPNGVQINAEMMRREFELMRGLIWMDQNRRIMEMSLDTPPCKSSSAKECPYYGGNFKAMYVLEVNAGIAGKNGLKTGDVLDF